MILWLTLFLSFTLNALLFGAMRDLRKDLAAVRADRDRILQTKP